MELLDDVVELAAAEDPDSLSDCWTACRPGLKLRHLEWCIQNLVNELGRPFSHTGFPHIGAPGGPSDAIDDPRVRTITQQFAAQVSKTLTGQSFLLYKAANEPAPSMYAGPTEQVAKDVIGRSYEMARRTPGLSHLLVKSEREQRQSLMEFRDNKVYVAWARSPSTLGDKPVRWGHAGEIDKWEHASTSKEAHPIKLFTDRFKQFQSMRKVILESTPTVRGLSLVERFLLAGTNCRYWVPCFQCGGYQVLEFFEGPGVYGVKWEKGENGHSNPALAHKTAFYQCRFCEGKIKDEHRGRMMRRGVWCPEGCTVKDKEASEAVDRYAATLQRNLEAGDGPREDVWRGWKNAEWIDGAPNNDGTDASYHLSSLYSLSLSWGDVAKEYLDCKKIQSLVRNFHNQWLANTWEIAERKLTWEQLGGRLNSEFDRGVVPRGLGFVTIGVDKQGACYPYVVKAWGPGYSGHTVAYGLCEDLEELRAIIATKWAIAGNGQIQAGLTLIDSGYKPADVLAFCERCRREGLRVQACKGSSTPMTAVAMRRQNGPRSSNPGKWVTWVDTNSTQDWLDQRLHVVGRGDSGAMTIHAGSLAYHQNYLEQLLNDAAVSALDKKNQLKEEWQRIDPNMPNDFRDCERYAYAAVMIDFKGRDVPSTPIVVESRPQPKAPEDQQRRKLEVRRPRGGSFVRRRR